eukprot:1777271-Prymnesium_polylepis.1
MLARLPSLRPPRPPRRRSVSRAAARARVAADGESLCADSHPRSRFVAVSRTPPLGRRPRV